MHLHMKCNTKVTCKYSFNFTETQTLTTAVHYIYYLKLTVYKLCP